MGTLLAIALALSTPCPTEDSVSCYWDAQVRGNGAGHSFMVLPVGDLDLFIRDDGQVRWVQ